MPALVLTLNAGSSSLKFSVFETGGTALVQRASGLVDAIGSAPEMTVQIGDGRTRVAAIKAAPGHGHEAAEDAVFNWLDANFHTERFAAVGHRIVHGGALRTESTILDDASLEELEALQIFAPLHQPHNLAGVRAAEEALPHTVQVGCYDTAFHRGHAKVNELFAIPRKYYDKGVRRYGFHGLSYAYIARRLREVAPDIADERVVVAHLGNGASMCAIRQGRSVASTMGFTAFDGLPMGTRCGQIDPGVLIYLIEQEGLSTREVSDLLYRQSGLLGLSGISNDMRVLEASDAPEAAEAIAYSAARIRHELGSLTADLRGLDALIFTAGIGENSARIRREACTGMEWFGIELDRTRNEAGETIISTPESRVKVMVIPTNEELMIARDTVRLAGL